MCRSVQQIGRTNNDVPECWRMRSNRESGSGIVMLLCCLRRGFAMARLAPAQGGHSALSTPVDAGLALRAAGMRLGARDVLVVVRVGMSTSDERSWPNKLLV